MIPTDEAPSYPFPYVGHGVGAARKSLECFIVFVRAVRANERAWVEEGAPYPLSEYFDWGKRSLTFGGHSDSLEYVVAGAYPAAADEPSPPAGPSQWRALDRALNDWLLRVHERHPIQFFVKPIDDEYGTETDAWHTWSVALIPELLGDTHALGKKYRWVLVELVESWTYALHQRPITEQRATVEALSPEALRIFTLLGETPTPQERPTYDKRPSPTVGLDTWKRLAAESREMLSARFEQALHLNLPPGEDYGLVSLAVDLLEKGSYADVVEIARASVKEDPEMWSDLLARGLIGSGKLGEAEQVLPQVCLHFARHLNHMTALIEYYRAIGDEKAVAACKAAEPAWPRTPIDAFSEIYETWIARIWNVRQFSTSVLAGFCVSVEGTGREVGFKNDNLLAKRREAKDEIARRHKEIDPWVASFAELDGEALAQSLDALPFPPAEEKVAYALLGASWRAAQSRQFELARRACEKVIDATKPSSRVHHAAYNLLLDIVYAADPKRAPELHLAARAMAPSYPAIFATIALNEALLGHGDVALEYLRLAKAHAGHHEWPTEKFLELRLHAAFASVRSDPLAEDDVKELFAVEDSAIAEKTRLIRQNPSDWWAVFSRGLLHHERGDIVRAEADYKRTIELNSSYPDVYVNVGNIFWSRDKNFAEAVRWYDKALDLAPDQLTARLNRAEAKLHLGDAAGALADSIHALGLNEKLAQPHLLAALAHAAVGDGVSARKHARTGRAIDGRMSGVDVPAWREKLETLASA